MNEITLEEIRTVSKGSYVSTDTTVFPVSRFSSQPDRLVVVMTTDTVTRGFCVEDEHHGEDG